MTTVQPRRTPEAGDPWAPLATALPAQPGAARPAAAPAAAGRLAAARLAVARVATAPEQAALRPLEAQARGPAAALTTPMEAALSHLEAIRPRSRAAPKC